MADWSRINLDELNERAGLLDREEHKYVVDADALSESFAALRRSFDVLEIAGHTTFTYDTVYYDTEDLLCYRQHAQGKRLRAKVRSRRYVDSDLLYFEVKLKGRRGRTIKHRFRYEHHGEVTTEARNFLAESAGDEYGFDLATTWSASLAMTYRRMTLVGRQSPERVTIDFGLRFDDGPHAVVTPRRTVIVEVKSPNGRGVADEIFRQSGVRPESCSKYCVGLVLTADGLPYNRFAKTLRTHFDWKGPTAMHEPDDHNVAHRIARRIADGLDRPVPLPDIEAVVQEELDALREARVRNFVEILVQRSATSRLRNAA